MFQHYCRILLRLQLCFAVFFLIQGCRGTSSCRCVWGIWWRLGALISTLFRTWFPLNSCRHISVVRTALDSRSLSSVGLSFLFVLVSKILVFTTQNSKPHWEAMGLCVFWNILTQATACSSKCWSCIACSFYCLGVYEHRTNDFTFQGTATLWSWVWKRTL